MADQLHEPNVPGPTPGSAEPAPPATPTAPPPPAAPNAFELARARMSAAEQLVVIGAALLLLVEVVFGVILETYYIGQVALLLVVAVLVAAFIKRVRGGDVPLGYVTVLRIAGFAVGIIALVDVVYELRHLDLGDAIDLLAAFGYYLGAALMAAGAWQMKER